MPKQTHNSKESQDVNKTHSIHYQMRKRLYTLEEASEYLGRSVYSVRCLLWNGSLPFIKQDGSKKQYLDLNDMDSWIEKNRRFNR